MPTRQRTRGPLIVVGLPRSGSSFMAHVLSTLDGLWVFDDLYAVQKAEAIGFGPFTDDQLEQFVDRLAWETRARIIWEEDFAAPALSVSDVDRMEAEMLERHRGRAPEWSELTSEWVSQLAEAHDCERWGYKTPQDFLHLDLLQETWPDARFIYLLRDPRDIMQSYKNLRVHKGGDGDPRSYHPVAYALYWRMAHRRLRRAIRQGRQEIALVKFEELVDTPNQVAARLAAFVGTTTSGPAETKSHNSSLAGGPRRSLTDTEIWICQRLAGPEMVDAGYQLKPVRPRLGDLREILRVTAGFVAFQTKRTVTDPEKRASVRNVARSAFTVD